MLKPWKKIGSRPLGDFRIFTVRADKKVSPLTQKEHEFFIIDSVTWVNVIAVTPDQQLVMVEQYRHGSNTVELEIPGGMMDAKDASPEFCGQRELREETGYAGTNARLISNVWANPAIMSNVCCTVMVENCKCVHPLEWDHAEELVTKLVPVAELPALVASGKIRHPLVVVALYHFELLQRGLKKC
ncbi:MAG TPA: NUDIX hydrolase [Candidatus Polarisedimenticolia bacterium]|nr:NUDIX hydrolase [Candidatus Polarisedimenticolia bacterium]